MVPDPSEGADDLVIIGHDPVLSSLEYPEATTAAHEANAPFTTPSLVQIHHLLSQESSIRGSGRSVDFDSCKKKYTMRSPTSKEADALPPPSSEPFASSRRPVYQCREAALNELNSRPPANVASYVNLPSRGSDNGTAFPPASSVPRPLPTRAINLPDHVQAVVTSPSLPPPPPPPPPPPTAPFASSATPFFPCAQVSSPDALVPASYAGESPLDASHIVRIEPFKRNVLISQHCSEAADLAEYQWLLEHGNTEVWYEKPHRAFFRQMKNRKRNCYEDLELLPLYDARPVSLETPKLWAARALSTPTDDDVYDCTAGHITADAYASTCHQCSEEKSEALDATSLQYCLVMTTCQASNPFIHGSHFNGRQIYKIVKCGSREAAVSEAFYATGVNGWNIAFSCVLRLGEGFDDKNGKIHRVDELWKLADGGENDEDSIRVFF